MDNVHGGGKGRSAAEELILRTVAAHAESLLRTARRHSLCLDDAQDAYQRALEIFMANAERLDPGRASAWLHVVVKREAQAIRRARQRLVSTDDVDLDKHEAPSVPTPEERLLTFDMLTRSAEALQRLKPQELRALWLKAQGHSYSDIGAITGWSYTKVNRCVAEGRRAFLERYAGIESGEECLRWRPVISAMVDGEATTEQLADLRPHLRNCPGCRATLKALRDSHEPLAALFPIPLVALDAGTGDQVSNVLIRIYEGFAGGLHERAVHSVTKVQAAFEAAATGKIAAVAASAAAVAGGGVATVDRGAGERERERRPAKSEVVRKSVQRMTSAPAQTPTTAAVVPQRPVSPGAPAATPVQAPPESSATPTAAREASSPEFGLERQATPADPPADLTPVRPPARAARAATSDSAAAKRSDSSGPGGSAPRRSPGTTSSAADEFGP